jgi:hypothetical protein
MKVSQGLVFCRFEELSMKELLLLALVFLPVFKSVGQTAEFVLVKEEGNISIYERWIKFPKSDPPIEAREVKGEFVFNNTSAAGVALLQNEEKIQLWQHHVSEFKVYPQTDTSYWYEYSYHDIPWPVSDQDHYLIYEFVESKKNTIFVTFESRADNVKAPVRKGVTRMTLSGSWTFEQITPKQCKATYRILSKPMNIPKFLTDPIIRNNMMTTIQRFIAIMEGRTPE